MTMYTLHNPVGIAPNLQPGICIGSDWVTIDYSGRPGRDGRTRYTYTLLIGDTKYTADDLQSGCQGGSLGQGLETLMSFLSYTAEWYRYHILGNRPDEDGCGFPLAVAEWCYQNETEIQCSWTDLKENPDAIEE